MKRLVLLTIGVALALPTAVTAQAYAPTPSAQEYLNFVSGSGENGSFGVQVGPYWGRFSSQPAASSSFNLYCVDFDHYAKSTAVNASEIGADLSLTRLGSTGGNVAAYTQAAYLATMFDTADESVWSTIHAAIWTTIRGGLDPADPKYGDPVPSASWTARDALVNEAVAAVAGGWSATGWYVLTPDATPPSGWVFRDGQEFLIRTASVPEPATALLMVTGLLLMAALGRRRPTEATRKG